MTHPARLLLPLFTVFLLMTAVGCGTSKKNLNGIDLHLDTISKVERNGSSVALTAVIRYTNETVVPIGITGSDITLFINGMEIQRVESTRPIGTPSFGSNTQETVFTLADASQASALLAALRTGSVSYRLETRLEIMSGETELFSKPISSGTVSLSGVDIP